jgi:hypothetical protein
MTIVLMGHAMITSVDLAMMIPKMVMRLMRTVGVSVEATALLVIIVVCSIMHVNRNFVSEASV